LKEQEIDGILFGAVDEILERQFHRGNGPGFTFKFMYDAVAEKELVAEAILSEGNVRGLDARIVLVQRMFAGPNNLEGVPRRRFANTAEMKPATKSYETVRLDEERGVSGRQFFKKLKIGDGRAREGKVCEVHGESVTAVSGIGKGKRSIECR